MPHSIITLKNGIKLVHKEVASPISHFGILVNAGTRDEKPEQSGLAHFVEHTLFKGTEKRKGYQVIKRIEDVGGDLNASTSKEETYFHASFLSPDYERTVELFSDIFFHASFPEKELEREKDVVYEEIKYYRDTPSELIFDQFEEIVFQQHPLGRSILGSNKSVKHLQRDHILSFIHDNYTKDTIVLSSVGEIGTDKLTKLCESYFGNTPLLQVSRCRTPFDGYRPQHVKVHKNTSQVHTVWGLPAYDLQNDKRLSFMLLTNLLGGQGMNTRLNRAIRERKGLAYSVEANYSPFSDTGLFSIYIGCDNHTLEQAVHLSFKELDKLKTDALGSLQLHYAKKQFIGQIAISNEMKLNEMLSNGRSALFFDEVETIEESIRKIENVSASDILEVANEIFTENNFSSLTYSKS